MARPSKAGLDYFELDCHMEEKVKLIQAEYGLKGFAIVVKLYQKIYGGFGYYCEWSEDSLLLFMSENGLSGDSKNLIKDIVSACIRRDIFSERLFNKFGILTSEGVQKRYLNATARREKDKQKKEYLLISIGKNNKNVVINSINVDKNYLNDFENTQSREEKSRVDNNIVEQSTTDHTAYKQIIDYLNKKTGKSFRHNTKATQTVIHARLVEGFTVDDFKTVIDKKSAQWKDDAKMSAYLRPETLFSPKHFESYLNEDYDPGKVSSGKKNKFNDFPQRNCDYESLVQQAAINRRKQLIAGNN